MSILGTDSSETLVGSINADEIYGLLGDDYLLGKGGADYLDGGGGNDTLDAGSGNDTVIGRAGDDYFYFHESFGDDSLVGGAGYDYFEDWNGNNVLLGGDDADLFHVFKFDGTDTVTGGNGADTYQVSQLVLGDYLITDFAVGVERDLIDVDELLIASAGDGYYLTGNPFSQSFLLLYQSGPDTILYWDRDGAGSEYAWDPMLTLQNVSAAAVTAANFVDGINPLGTATPPVTVTGGTGDDLLNGAFGNDSIFGDSGYDTLNGRGGDDIVDGWEDDDYLNGGLGNDTVYGWTGNDFFFGNAAGSQDWGDDWLYGEDGDDVLFDSHGWNVLIGGDGADSFWVNFFGPDGYTIAFGGELGAADFYQDEYDISATAVDGDYEIWDFAAGTGGDLLDVADVMTESAAGDYYTNGNPFGNGFLQLVLFNAGDDAFVDDTRLDWDRDGPGIEYGYEKLLTLLDVTPAEFTAANFKGGIAPNGANVPGVVLTGNDAFGDFIEGGFFDDTIYGLDGDDWLDGKLGNDLVVGGLGDDHNLIGGAGSDTVLGGQGDDEITEIYSLNGHSLGDDSLDGGGGNDLISDHFGDNTMVGGNGDDTLIAFGNGSTVMTGGAGIDVFEVWTLSVSHDHAVTDFAVGFGGDLLDVDDLLVFSSITGAYTGGNPFDPGLGIMRLTQDTIAGAALLEWDADGLAGLYDWVAMIALQGIDKSTITSDNFVGQFLIGTEFSDDLFTGPGNDTILGLGGNDTIDGSSGHDSLVGGFGNDLYYVDDAGDEVIELNNDLPGGLVLPGWGSGSPHSALADTLLDGITDTVISAINFSLVNLAYVEILTLTDTAIQGTGNDLANILNGNALANALVALDGEDTLTGAAGNDTLDGGAGNDVAFGSVGDDSLMGGLGSDNLQGNAGIDTLIGNAGNDTLDGGPDADLIYGSVDDDSVLGSAGIDTLVGNAGNDVLDGGTENDQVFGSIGDDVVRGGLGADVVQGNAGNDTVIGGDGTGTDTLDGNDSLDGGAGNDSLSGGFGNDNELGGAGFDTLIGNAGNDTLDGGADGDLAYGSAGDDSIVGGAGIDTLVGNAGNDTIDGGTEDDQVFGSIGNDLVLGGAGNDVVQGNAGFDTIVGGAGNDTMQGNADTDTFRYDATSLNTLDVAAGQADAITATAVGDLISMLGVIDELEIGNVALSALTANTVVGSALSAGVTNIAYTGGVLRVDLDGSGTFVAGSDFQISLTGVTTVTYFQSDDLFHLA